MRETTLTPAAARNVLYASILSSFLSTFMASSVNIALPQIGRQFAMSAVLLGWVQTMYLLSTTVFLLPFGRLGDLYGKRHIFLYGTILFTVASLALAVAPGPASLIALRFFQGIGSALMFSTITALLISAYPPDQRGKALGTSVSATYLGLSAGPFIGGWLVASLGWHSIFWVTGALGLATVVFTAVNLPRENMAKLKESFDLPGALLYGTGLSLLLYGFSLLPRPTGIALSASGAVFLAVFFVWERAARHPLLEMRLLFENRVFAFSNLAALINYSATFSVAFILSLYLQFVRGFSPQAAGTILLIQPLVQAVFSPFAGRLSDRTEPRLVASAGMAFTAAGLLMLVPITAAEPVVTVSGILAVLGFGFALFSSPNTNAAMSAADRKYYGVASSTLSTMRMAGQMLSMGTVTIIFSFYLGSSPLVPAVYPAFLSSSRTAFAVAAVLCGAGIVFSLVRGVKPK